MATRAAVLVGIVFCASLLLSTVLPTHSHQIGEEQQMQQQQQQQQHSRDGGVGLGVSVAHPDTQVRAEAASCPIAQLAEPTVRSFAACIFSPGAVSLCALCQFQYFEVHACSIWNRPEKVHLIIFGCASVFMVYEGFLAA